MRILTMPTLGRLLLGAVIAMMLGSGVWGDLPTCDNNNNSNNTCPEFSTCSNSTSNCTCIAGYHLNSTANRCAADLRPGQPCGHNGSEAECVDHATCSSVGSAELHCVCNSGYRPSTRNDSSTGTVDFCVKVLAVNESCSEPMNATECAENSTCSEGRCTCVQGFHALHDNDTQNTECEMDKRVEEACTQLGSGGECIDHATCVGAGTNSSTLLCRCVDGFHPRPGDLAFCDADKSVGETCTQLGGRGECVANASCQPADSGNATFQCRCDKGFRPKKDNSSTCVAVLALGASCTEGQEDCLDNASCQGTNGTFLCQCLPGFHATDSACRADLALGAACNSSDECVDSATCRSNGTALLCLCDVGFHPTAKDNSSACEADKAHGETCTQLGGREECVARASCQPAVSGNTTLQCRCDAGFHPKKDNSSACVADLPLGTSCTEGQEDCVANASCQGTNGTFLCQCLPGFHVNDSACRADVVPGAACTRGNSSDECVDSATCRTVPQPESNQSALLCLCDDGFHPAPLGNRSTCEADLTLNATCSYKGFGQCMPGAACVNVAAAGQPEVLQCRCALDYYQLQDRCQPALSPGQNCQQNASSTECVSNATCTVAQPDNSSSSLQCQCDEQFHPALDGAQRLRCLADVCSDTRKKCDQEFANITSCNDATAFIKCMMVGSCNPQNTTQVSELASAMLYAEQRLPSGCEYNDTTSCSNIVISLLTNFLRVEDRNCTTVGNLTVKQNAAVEQCGTDKTYVLAKALVRHYAQQLSCEVSNSSPQVTLGVSMFLTVLLAVVSAVHAFVNA